MTGQPWGFRRAAPRRAFIVRRRSVTFWTTKTIRGPRRVKRMTPWQSVQYFNTLDEAERYQERSRKTDSTTDWAIFHAGKRIDGKRCRGSHKDAPHGDAASCPDCGAILNIRADWTFPAHLPKELR